MVRLRRGADRNGRASLSVASYKDLLYIGGEFTEAAGPEARGLAVWDGETWQAIDEGLSGGQFFGPSVFDMSIAGEGETASLLLGGAFDFADAEPTDQVARYTYCAHPAGINGEKTGRQALQLRLFPNPMIAGASYAIQLSQAARVRASIVDVSGRVGEELWERSLAAGVHHFDLDPNRGRWFAGGIHYLRITTEKQSVTQRVVLVP